MLEGEDISFRISTDQFVQIIRPGRETRTTARYDQTRLHQMLLSYPGKLMRELLSHLDSLGMST